MKSACILSLVLAIGCDSGGGGPGVDSGRPPTDGGHGQWQPLPTVAACGTPTATDPVDAAATDAVFSLAFAWGGTEAGLAYAERDGANWQVRLQRVSAAGALIGTAIDVDTSSVMPDVAVATDGQVYVVCFESSTGVSCHSVPLTTGGPAAGAEIAGASSPSLAMGPSGMVLVYSTASAVSASHIDASAQLVGNPAPIATSMASSTSVTGTSGGYVVGAVAASGHLYRLDPQLAVVGTPTAVVTAAYLMVSSAGADTFATWIGADNESHAAVFSAGGTLSADATLSTGASSYGRVAIAAGGGKAAVTWSDFGGFIGYRVLSGTGAAEGTAVHYDTSWDDNVHAIVATSTGFLLAIATTPSAHPVEIRALSCP